MFQQFSTDHMHTFNTPKPILLTTLGLAAINGLVALAACILCFREDAYFLLSFEFVVLVASVFGVLVGLGRFATGPALTIGMVAAVYIVSSVLGDPALFLGLLNRPVEAEQLMGISSEWIMAAHGISGLLFGLLAVLAVWLRETKKATQFVVIGVALMLPVLGVLGLLVVGPGVSMLGKLSGWLVAIVSVLLFFVLGTLTCASGHLLIRSLEFGKAPDAEPAVVRPSKTNNKGAGGAGASKPA